MKKIHFIINFIFGILFIFILSFFENTTIVEDLYNPQFDYLLNTKLNKAQEQPFNDGNITFIELNDKFFNDNNATYSAYTPRDGLALLLENVVKENPKVIFLDIFLHHKLTPAQDKFFIETLQNILINKQNNTKFIFPLKLYMNQDGNDDIVYPYFREELQDFENKRIFYAISAFYGYEDDIVKRYFYNDKKINNKRLYAVPLLTKILMEDNNAKKLFFDKQTIDLSSKDILVKNRINFYFYKGWKEHNNKTVELNMINKISIFNSNNFQNLKGKAVYIGVNRPIMGDIWKTSIGKSSGMYILGNIYLTLNNPIHSLSPLWKYVILLLIVMLMSYLLTIFDSIISMLIMVIAIVLMYFLSSWLFLQYGIFISVLVPLFYIFKHGDFAEILESIVQKGLSWVEYYKLNRKGKK